MFAKGALAMYFGYASEMSEIKKRNPHLNFDLARSPPNKGDKSKTSFAKIYALAIMKNSSRTGKKGGFGFNFIYAFQSSFKDFSQATGLASPRRDLLAEKTTDAYFGLLNKAAVMSKAWLEPDSDGGSPNFQRYGRIGVIGQFVRGRFGEAGKKQVGPGIKKICH